MKAIKLNKPYDVVLEDIAKPEWKKGMALLKVHSVGICGSDIGAYRGANQLVTYPRVIGHEVAGEILEIDEDNKRGLKKGDRVVVDPYLYCGHCYPCSLGRGNVCDNLKVRGVHIDGGYREFLAVPDSDCYLLPDSLSDRDAVMIEPTTIAIQSCSRAELTAEDTLLLYGYGSLGSSIFRIASQICPNIIVAELSDEKLAAAKAHGAAHTINTQKEDFLERVSAYTNGRGSTVSIDAACSKGSLLNLLKATGNAGRVITMGFSTDPTEINQFMITSKDLDVRGSRLQNRMFGKAIEMIREGKLDLNGVVSHTFPLIEAQKAFDFADTHDPSIRKIVLTFDF